MLVYLLSVYTQNIPAGNIDVEKRWKRKNTSTFDTFSTLKKPCKSGLCYIMQKERIPNIPEIPEHCFYKVFTSCVLSYSASHYVYDLRKTWCDYVS